MKLASQSRGRGQKPTCVSCLPGKVHAAANTKFCSDPGYLRNHFSINKLHFCKVLVILKGRIIGGQFNMRILLLMKIGDLYLYINS